MSRGPSGFFSVQSLCSLCLRGGSAQSTPQRHRGHRDCTEKKLPSVFLIVFLASSVVSGCRQETDRARVPSEVQEVVANVGEQMAQDRYDQLYNESSELWKKD